MAEINEITGAWLKGFTMGLLSEGNAKKKTTYITFSSNEYFIIRTINNKANWDGQLYYSTDLQQWDIWATGEKLDSQIHEGKYKIYLRGIGNHWISGGPDWRWVITGEAGVYCDGNIENLLDFQVVAMGDHPEMDDYCFSNLFNGCEVLITPPQLGALTLSAHCYELMFGQCSNLEKAPSLRAMALADFCYYNMFAACSSLKELPILPAKDLPESCYYGMFWGCEQIKLSQNQTGIYQNSYRVPYGSWNSMGKNSIYAMFYSTGGPFNTAITPGQVYFTSNALV